MTEDLEAPLFNTAKGAILFAMNFSHGTLKRPYLITLMGGGRPGRGLAGLDGAGQAGMIKAELESLSMLHVAVLTARYAPRSQPCSCKRSCCRGFVETPEWNEAIKFLTGHVLEMGLTGTVSHYHLRRSLVKRYFGVRLSFIDISKECGINRDTASDQFAKVTTYFRGNPPQHRGVEWHAFNAFEARMKEARLVE